jgi:hypothetical protein
MKLQVASLRMTGYLNLFAMLAYQAHMRLAGDLNV